MRHDDDEEFEKDDEEFEKDDDIFDDLDNEFDKDNGEESISEEEKEKYYWIEFEIYSKKEGIGLEYYEDFITWWDIWKKAIDVEISKHK